MFASSMLVPPCIAFISIIIPRCQPITTTTPPARPEWHTQTAASSSSSSEESRSSREIQQHRQQQQHQEQAERMERRLLNTLPRKKSVFRDKFTNGNNNNNGIFGEEAEEFLGMMADGMMARQGKVAEQQHQHYEEAEGNQQKEEKEEEEEVHFFRPEGEQQRPAASATTKREQSSQNQFEQTRFDQQFPVHNLCGPWNSGNQASNLEWAEPGDKLLKLLSGTSGDGSKYKYNLFMAPGQMTGHPTNVSIAIYIESMSSFKAQTMDYEVDMYFAMGWYDRRLAHNCTHPLLITHKQIAERIWTPDLYFLNAKFAYLQEVTTPNFMLIVYPDGLVFKTLRIDVTLSCNMDLQMFPFDKQECPMVIQSFAYIESMLNLSWHVDPPFYPIAMNPELKLNDMAITRMRFERCSSPYTMFRGTGVWSCIRGYIVMKRLVLFHLIQTYIPSAMLVSISWMTFWLDPRASPARISLTITSLLTLTTMTNGARQDLPQVSYIKAMDIWQTFSQALIFLVLLEYSFVSYYFTKRTFHCRHRNNFPAPKGSRKKAQQQLIYTMMMMRNNTLDDVRLGGGGHAATAAAAMAKIQNNSNNHNGGPLMMDQGVMSETFGRRRHSSAAESVGANRALARQHSQQQNTPSSAILATLPPPLIASHVYNPPVETAASPVAIGGYGNGTNPLPNRLRHRRLCAESSDFELAGILAPETGTEEADAGKTMTGGEGAAAKDEEEEDDGVDRPCQRCQCLNQRTARAIDRYSRLVFPVIFTAFCACYWSYYWHVMAAHDG